MNKYKQIERKNKIKKDTFFTPHIAGFCKAATIDEVKEANYVLTPGRYVGTDAEEDDGIPFGEKMNTLTTKLAEQFSKSSELENQIRKNLKSIGYEF